MPRASAARTSRVIRLRKFSKSACVRWARARYCVGLLGALAQRGGVELDLGLDRLLLASGTGAAAPSEPAAAGAAGSCWATRRRAAPVCPAPPRRSISCSCGEGTG